MHKLICGFIILLAWSRIGLSQTVCREFDPTAQIGKVANSALTEISGIAASRQNPNIIWAHNDSGDSARLFAMRSDGTHLATYYLDGASHVDWEDMAIGPGPIAGQDYLYVADTGNNNLDRTTLTIYRVPEPVVEAGEFHFTAVEAFQIRYPNGPFDAETLLVDPITAEVLLVTRDRSKTGSSYVFTSPPLIDPTTVITLQWAATISSNLEVKGGAVSADGHWILLRPHSSSAPVNGWLWHREDNTLPLETVFSFSPCLVPLAFEPQGEAISFSADAGSYFTISEGSAQPIYYYASLSPPLPPGSPSATALSDTQIRLAWTDVANNESGYVVERSSDGGVSFVQVTTVAANATSYTESGLLPSTTYWYRIAAYNNAGAAYSMLVSATTPAPLPAAPGSLSATAFSKSQINLSWSDNSSNEDGFKIERSTDGRTFAQIVTTGPDVRSFSNLGLAANKTYYYRVRAYNAGGASAYSNVVSARTLRK